MAVLQSVPNHTPCQVVCDSCGDFWLNWKPTAESNEPTESYSAVQQGVYCSSASLTDPAEDNSVGRNQCSLSPNKIKKSPSHFLSIHQFEFHSFPNDFPPTTYQTIETSGLQSVSSSGFSKSGKPILLWEIFLVEYDRLTPDSQRILPRIQMQYYHGRGVI